MLKKIEKTLKQYWGYDEFRPLQKEAMLSAISGRDSLVVLPTGGGKSLCFQVPAMSLDGITLVISPLISLMKDQVDGLVDCGVPAARLDSTVSPEDRTAIYRQAFAGELKLLYLSPERLMSKGFTDFISDLNITMVAVDEAHCVSMWGHDFRPEYRQLGRLKQIFGAIPIHAYTATATGQVRDDIAKQLKLDKPEILVGSFDRPNLFYRIMQRENRMKQLKEIIDRHEGESGIIYCIKRSDTEQVAKSLNKEGYKALPYHAGLTDEKRRKHQDAFIKEKTDIIVATIAFGMGIDKSNVRYVIHCGMPKSLENYQQESGRAGRDGLNSECVLLYSPGDFALWKSIMQDMPTEALKISEGKLSYMYSFCTGATCRHQAILNYFDQKLENDNCQACDICLDEVEQVEDALIVAQKIISCVARLNQSFGSNYTAEVLTGSNNMRLIMNRHQELSTYGLMAEHKQPTIRNWIEQLVGQDYLAKVGEYHVLAITKSGWEVLRGNITPRLLKASEKTKDTKSKAKPKAHLNDLSSGQIELFEILRQIRREIADKKGIPAYLIFNDATLHDMAYQMPIDDEQLLQIHGVGVQKKSKYGKKFIKAIIKFKESQ
ncbi:MAG: DNA helicase RecQ [Phycisphaerae bacterium]|nr:DNA helicase RecQ [Phycisphaerae bacterium]